MVERVAELESEVAALRGAITKLARSLGEPDPLVIRPIDSEHN